MVQTRGGFVQRGRGREKGGTRGQSNADNVVHKKEDKNFKKLPEEAYGEVKLRQEKDTLRVPLSNIQNLDLNKDFSKRKYKIKIDEKHHDGQVIRVAESKKDLDKLISAKRPRITPFDQLMTATSAGSEDEFENPPKKSKITIPMINQKIGELQLLQKAVSRPLKEDKRTTVVNKYKPVKNLAQKFAVGSSNEYPLKTKSMMEKAGAAQKFVHWKDVPHSPNSRTSPRSETSNPDASRQILVQKTGQVLSGEINQSPGEIIYMRTAPALPKSNESGKNSEKVHAILPETNSTKVPVQMQKPQKQVLTGSNTDREKLREKVEALESLIRSLRKNLSETKDDRRLKKEEILSLKTKLQSLNDVMRAQALEISTLRNLNRKLTEIAINNADKLNAKLEEITKHNTVNVSSPYAAVGKTLQNGDIHLGKDSWLSAREYATVLCAVNKVHHFVQNLSVVLFGYNTLLRSTVTGKGSNRNKGIKVPPDGSLNDETIMICKEMYKWWLQKQRKYTEPEADKEAEKTRFYIGQKIASLKRAQRIKREGTENIYLDSDNDDQGEENPSENMQGNAELGDVQGDPLEDFQSYSPLQDVQDNVSLLDSIQDMEQSKIGDKENGGNNNEDNESDNSDIEGNGSEGRASAEVPYSSADEEIGSEENLDNSSEGELDSEDDSVNLDNREINNDDQNGEINVSSGITDGQEARPQFVNVLENVDDIENILPSYYIGFAEN